MDIGVNSRLPIIALQGFEIAFQFVSAARRVILRADRADLLHQLLRETLLRGVFVALTLRRNQQGRIRVQRNQLRVHAALR